jgi:hypothetical protein
MTDNDLAREEMPKRMVRISWISTHQAATWFGTVEGELQRMRADGAGLPSHVQYHIGTRLSYQH